MFCRQCIILFGAEEYIMDMVMTITIRKIIPHTYPNQAATHTHTHTKTLANGTLENHFEKIT